MKIIKSVPKKTIDDPLGYEIICERKNLADFKKTSIISGNRSYILKNELVFLEQAILMHVLSKLQKKGFNIITVPSFINKQSLWNAGYFPERENDHFRIEDNKYLASTSEIFINSLHSGEIIDKKILPLLYCAISKCFRTEYDNHSRGSKGLIRVHEFTKVEQFVICKNSKEESSHWHYKLLGISEEILKDLELPYRVVEFDKEKGPGKVLMHDIQVWFPSEFRHRETHSCSSYLDWQARRTNLKYSTDTEYKFCHTINCTAIATPRILAAILENHQNTNGKINIPYAIKNYFNNKECF